MESYLDPSIYCQNSCCCFRRKFKTEPSNTASDYSLRYQAEADIEEITRIGTLRLFSLFLKLLLHHTSPYLVRQKLPIISQVRQNSTAYTNGGLSGM